MLLITTGKYSLISQFFQPEIDDNTCLIRLAAYFCRLNSRITEIRLNIPCCFLYLYICRRVLVLPLQPTPQPAPHLTPFSHPFGCLIARRGTERVGWISNAFACQIDNKRLLFFRSFFSYLARKKVIFVYNSIRFI